MTTTDTGLAPVVKTSTVPQDPARAFRLFTEHMGAWWPLLTHSVGAERATGIEFGTGVGGKIIEMIEDGSTSAWGTITAWSPPDRVEFTWHPGSPEGEATNVEVTFVASDGGTTVTLTHAGWANRPDGVRARAGYVPGWDLVLGRYAAVAAA